MIKVKIDTDKCKGCKLCVAYCQKGLIKESQKLNKKGIYVVEFDEGRGSCSGCRFCALMCPESAIEIINEESNEEKKQPKK